MYTIKMKIKLNNNRLEGKGKCRKLNLKEINTSTFVMESSLDKDLFQLMMRQVLLMTPQYLEKSQL